MSLSSRVATLEAAATFASEPRTFAELAEWCETGRAFTIEPDSRWWPLWLAAQRHDDTEPRKDETNV